LLLDALSAASNIALMSFLVMTLVLTGALGAGAALIGAMVAVPQGSSSVAATRYRSVFMVVVYLRVARRDAWRRHIHMKLAIAPCV
jgi:hypothetical protein